MLVIALTGGIGSGKTTVSELFKKKNIPIIDTDIIARKIVECGQPAYSQIIKSFGDQILDIDKNINRKKLSKLVFSEIDKRIQLENILHPIIWKEVKTQLNDLKSHQSEKVPYCIIVVPLLIENLSKIDLVKFDRILVIDVDEKTQIDRAIKRDNSDESSVKKIINSQTSRKVRISTADDVILNSSKLESLSTEVDKLHFQYLNFSK